MLPSFCTKVCCRQDNRQEKITGRNWNQTFHNLELPCKRRSVERLIIVLALCWSCCPKLTHVLLLVCVSAAIWCWFGQFLSLHIILVSTGTPNVLIHCWTWFSRVWTVFTWGSSAQCVSSGLIRRNFLFCSASISSIGHFRVLFLPSQNCTTEAVGRIGNLSNNQNNRPLLSLLSLKATSRACLIHTFLPFLLSLCLFVATQRENRAVNSYFDFPSIFNSQF